LFSETHQSPPARRIPFLENLFFQPVYFSMYRPRLASEDVRTRPVTPVPKLFENPLRFPSSTVFCLGILCAIDAACSPFLLNQFPQSFFFFGPHPLLRILRPPLRITLSYPPSLPGVFVFFLFWFFCDPSFFGALRPNLLFFPL